MGERHDSIERCPKCAHFFDVNERVPAMTTWQFFVLFVDRLGFEIPGGSWFRVTCPNCEADFLSYRLKYFGWFTLSRLLIFLIVIVLAILGTSAALSR